MDHFMWSLKKFFRHAEKFYLENSELSDFSKFRRILLQDPWTGGKFEMVCMGDDTFLKKEGRESLLEALHIRG